MKLCSEKFKLLVVFGSPDLSLNKRQTLLQNYHIQAQVIFARDFPLNIKTGEDEMKQPTHRANLNFGDGIMSSQDQTVMVMS